jgi:tetratricopeptide (TPR) repeat protein
VHASTYFATRILYQRGKLDLTGVVARLHELLRSCPAFPEAQAMLRAAERGTLRPDPSAFNKATVPPPPGDYDDDEDTDPDRRTEPSDAPSSRPTAQPVEARLKTPQAPGIPRAPLLPRFTPRENVPPSYAPPPDLDLSGLDLELPRDPRWSLASDTVSAPPPSSTHEPRIKSPPPAALELGQNDSLQLPIGQRNTAPSPGAPGPSELELPSVFLIATWLAERDFERALAAVEKLGPESTPELSLLEVRALVGLGRKGAARRSLDRLCRAPLLDPDLRAAVARLLIELGDLDRAEAQARRAHTEDPASDLTRLTLAWAITRSDSWLLSPRSGSELGELLEEFSPEGSPLPALGFALRALALLQTSPEAARQAADTALTLDAASHDGLAVAALVAIKQSRTADAKRLYQRLLEVDHHAADELAATLGNLGLQVGRHAAPARASLPPAASVKPAAPPNPPSAIATPQAGSPWDERERRLSLGDGKAALFDFEQGLSRKLEGVQVRSGATELSQAAVIAARYLTESPVTRHFAPYDMSLFSIARLDAALSLLYRSGVGPRTELRARALLGLGAYAGECLRQAYAGEWLGTTGDMMRLHIEGQGLCFAPFKDIDARLQSGRPLDFGESPVPHPGAEPLGQRVTLSLAPPTPWDPATWPPASQLPELGTALKDSPVGLYCAATELPLDLSFASLRSIDRYVTLLAPPLAPPDAEGGWVRRAAVLVGSYLGEVLRATHGGSWETPRGDLRAEAYRIVLPRGAKALPVVAAYERLSGRRLEQPSDYARRVTS